ncbi:MAG: isoleucine--tRNA ligase [Clostridia bacterium]|nr:isoleucine--tRNA ligase [Clostridia bacterium]
MYKKVPTDMKFVDREAEVLSFWKENDIFKKSVALRKGAQTFTFYDGPPTANGKPHIGHVLTRAFKDIIPRYNTMKGYDVLRKAGWDTHGLPVELEVEHLLGIDGKPQIEAYGIEPFIGKCKESVWKYLSEWEVMSDRVGYWADMENPYVTYHNDYIESEWWSLKTLWDKGLIYHGHKVVPYCPRCGTALSSHEVAQGYKRVKETSVTVRFKVLGEENTYILAWTTTPWTLPSNICLCMNADVTYAKVLWQGQYLILAEALLDNVLGEGTYEIVDRKLGSEYIGVSYEPLYDWAKADRSRGYRVICDPYVTLEDGTGVVHNAPAFGEDDARVCKDNDLPFLCLVDLQGRFTPECEVAAGKFVKDADPEIIADLKERGLLFAALPYEHDYPFCWRCDTPLLYYARATWFIRMSSLRDKLLKNNASVNWIPETIGTGRMGNFLENVIDWGLSRDRYWGTPLPIWECSCGYQHMVGSIAELKELGRDVPDDIELHKPFIDNVHLVCPKCGKDMKRVPEVIDCWYDSGSMPFAQWHYPFENKEQFDSRFPADFICEAVDQTRGWFYTLLAISTAVFDCAPFRNCIVLGHVNDREGKKMSKHLGNVIAPSEVLDVQGADAVRWYFYISSAPWLPNRFSPEAVSETQRKYMSTLWNTYAFYILYADIDRIDPTKLTLSENPGLLDRWILSKLNSLIAAVDDDLAHYRVTEASRKMSDFTEELSNWYVRRGRERYWAGEMTQDKSDAFYTLFTVLKTMSLLTAPFTPFMAESIYQNLVRTVDPDAPESVHLADFPVSDASFIDPEIEEQMETVLKIVADGRALRNTANLKIRQPLAEMLVSGAELTDEFCALVADELNIKKVTLTDDLSDLVVYNLKPQLRTLGRRFGKNINLVRELLAAADGSAAVAAFRRGEDFHMEVNGVDEAFAEADLLIEEGQRDDYKTMVDGDMTVAICTILTDSLIREGFVRETISKIQTQRRDSGFNVSDHIAVSLKGDADLCALLDEDRSWMREVLADSVVFADAQDMREWDINGKPLCVALTVVEK